MVVRLKSSKLPTKEHKKQNGLYETLKKFSCISPQPHRIFQPSQTFPFPFLVILKVKTTSLSASLDSAIVWLGIHCKEYSIFSPYKKPFYANSLELQFYYPKF
jgi:hypothetical protein